MSSARCWSSVSSGSTLTSANVMIDEPLGLRPPSDDTTTVISVHYNDWSDFLNTTRNSHSCMYWARSNILAYLNAWPSTYKKSGDHGQNINRMPIWGICTVDTKTSIKQISQYLNKYWTFTAWNITHKLHFKKCGTCPPVHPVINAHV